MALRNLTAAEMITISDVWVDEESEEHALLSSAPETAVLLPHIKRSHQALLEKQSPGDSALDALGKTVSELDSRHDNLVRGIYNALESFAFLATDKEQRDELIGIRDTLFPSGLSLVLSGYRDEAGASILMEQRLTSEAKKTLKKMKSPNGTLLESVETLIGVGKELGQLEDRRAELRSQIDGPTAAEILAARNDWIKKTHALISALGLTEIDGEATAKLLAPLEEATKIADRRVSTRSGGATTEETTTTQPTTTTDGATTPTDEATTPSDGTTTPSDGTTTPSDGTTTPSDGTTTP